MGQTFLSSLLPCPDQTLACAQTSSSECGKQDRDDQAPAEGSFQSSSGETLSQDAISEHGSHSHRSGTPRTHIREVGGQACAQQSHGASGEKPRLRRSWSGAWRPLGARSPGRTVHRQNVPQEARAVPVSDGVRSRSIWANDSVPSGPKILQINVSFC